MVAAVTVCNMFFPAALNRADVSGARVGGTRPLLAAVMLLAQAVGVVPFPAALNSADVFWARVRCARISQATVMHRAHAFRAVWFLAAPDRAEVRCFSWHGIAPQKFV